MSFSEKHFCNLFRKNLKTSYDEWIVNTVKEIASYTGEDIVIRLHPNFVHKYNVSMYQITYLRFSLYDFIDNSKLSNMNVVIDKNQFGETLTNGSLKKMFEYIQPAINVNFNGDFYYPKDTTLSIIPGDDGTNDFHVKLNLMRYQFFNLIGKLKSFSL